MMVVEFAGCFVVVTTICWLTMTPWRRRLGLGAVTIAGQERLLRSARRRA